LFHGDGISAMSHLLHTQSRSEFCSGKREDRKIRDLVRTHGVEILRTLRFVPLRCSLVDVETLLSDREDFSCIETRGSDDERKTIWLDSSSVRWLKKSRIHRKCMQIVPAESEARGAGEPN
jgi:hypothetical protein